MSNVITLHETLSARGARLRALMDSAAYIPVAVATEVMAIIDNWSLYRDESGNLSPKAWTRRQFDRTPGYFRSRARAAERFGEVCVKMLDHFAAKWMSNNVPEQARIGQLKAEIRRAYVQNNRNPLCTKKVRPIVEALMGATPKRRPKNAPVRWIQGAPSTQQVQEHAAQYPMCNAKTANLFGGWIALPAEGFDPEFVKLRLYKGKIEFCTQQSRGSTEGLTWSVLSYAMFPITRCVPCDTEGVALVRHSLQAMNQPIAAE